MNSEVEGPKILSFPKLLDERGNLSFIEELKHIPFEIKRTYLVYDVPGGEIRGGHAYIKQQEIIVALSGSFDVVIDNGLDKSVFSLNRSYTGLFIPAGIWRHMENFSTNSVCLVIASTIYNEKDYLRDYKEFLTNRLQST
jgi:dTDP-4-dehydrorhamnose 3,5-epimerase-like enzyme